MASARDSSVPEVKVCLICGDKGETELLIYCRMCRDSAVHHYCMDNFSPDDDNINWWCWDCAHTDREVEPLKESERIGSERQKVLKTGKCWQEKLNQNKRLVQISNGINGTADLTIDGRFPILNLETQFLEERILDHDVVEQKKAIPEMPSHSEEHNELAEMNEIFAPKSTQSPHEENNTSSADETQKIEEDGKKKRNDSANSQEEGKNINLQASSVAAVDHCIGSNSLYQQPSLESDDCFSAEPVMDPIWRGWFNIKEESETSVEILAHLSNKACSKVSETASAIPPMLEIQVLDKCVAWPKSFRVSPPTAASIGLYFFPARERDETVFGNLLDEVIERDLALKTEIDNVELLIFSSRELPLQNWRQKSKYFLWGVFRKKQRSHSSTETASPNQQHNITEDFPLSEPSVEANNKVLVHPESAHMAGSIGSMRLGPPSVTPCMSQAGGSVAPSPSPSSVAQPPGLHKFIARAAEPVPPGHDRDHGPVVPPPAADASYAAEASRWAPRPPQSAPRSQSRPVDLARLGPSATMRNTLNAGPSIAPTSVATFPTPFSLAPPPPPPPPVVRKYISVSDASPPSPPPVVGADAPPTPSQLEPASMPPLIPTNSVTAGSPAAGPSSSEAPTRSWDAPPPPPPSAPPLPPVSQRHYISLQDARSDRDFHTAIHATVKGHYPHPWRNISQIPQEHKLFWFNNLKLSYWWDCDDESMFKVVKSQVGKFLRKRFAEARNQLARPLWLTEEIWRQLLKYWASPEFQALSVKNKVNRAANPDAAATVYRGGSSSIGAHKRKMETQLGRPVKQIEVFEKCYKKKENGQWSGPRAANVAELFLRMMEERQNQPNSNQDPTLSSQGLVAPNEQQVWLSAAGGRKRGRVFGLGSEAHHTVVGPSQPNGSTAPSPSPLQQPRPDLDDRVMRLEEWMQRIDPTWPDPLADPPVPDDEHEVEGDADLD